MRDNLKKIYSLTRGIKWWQGLILLVLACLVYFGTSFFGRASFSSSDIEVSISGPENFKSQEPVDFELILKNQSRFDLAGALYVTLPDFLVFSGSSDQERKLDFSQVKNGEEMTAKVSVLANDTQRQGDIKVRANYSPQGLNGQYEESNFMTISVSSLPLTAIFDLPDKAVDGQTIRGSFNFVADSELETSPLLARLILPEDFTLKDAEPMPSGTTTWEFEDVEADKIYKVDFEGLIKGYESEGKKFDLLFGVGDEDSEFDEQFKVSREVRISSAPIEFQQTVNGKAQHAGSLGEKLDFKISYTNKSGVDIEDVTITADISGEAFDFDKLDTGSGWFNEDTSTIIWNKDFLSRLSKIKKDENGYVEFSIHIKSNISPKDYTDRNMIVASVATIDSSRAPLALKGLSLRSEDSMRIKVKTELTLSSEGYYYEGPFSNSGPIPPRLDEVTTYTILWKASNALNEANEVVVEAPLPQYVLFNNGKIYPASSNLIYNSQTHSVLWNVGKMEPGVGSIFPAKTVAFQVSFLPTEDLRGSAPELVQLSKITGQDVFADEFVESVSTAITTALPDDEGMRGGDGIVE